MEKNITESKARISGRGVAISNQTDRNRPTEQLPPGSRTLREDQAMRSCGQKDVPQWREQQMQRHFSHNNIHT